MKKIVLISMVVSAGLISAFWAIRWFATGVIPTMQVMPVTDNYGKMIVPPVAIPRILDCLLAPWYTIILVILFRNERMRRRKTADGFMFGLLSSIILGIFVGIKNGTLGWTLGSGLALALVMWLVVGPNRFSSGFGIGAAIGTIFSAGLVFGLYIGIDFGSMAIAIIWLVTICDRLFFFRRRAPVTMFQTKTWDVTRFPVP